jgi:hypothetical protein
MLTRSHNLGHKLRHLLRVGAGRQRLKWLGVVAAAAGVAFISTESWIPEDKLWVDRAFVDTTSGAWIVEIFNHADTSLSCVVNWAGVAKKTVQRAGEVFGRSTFVLPPYAGHGSPPVVRAGFPNVERFTERTKCSRATRSN